MLLKKINLTNTLLILGVGLFVRLIFTWFFARSFYGLEYFYCQGDTGCWAGCFENWYNKGTYSYPFGVENGEFSRMPGYSFFLGIFYLIANKNWEIAYQICGYTQIILDVYSIYLIKSIAEKVFQNIQVASISAWLLALYPFAIVWAPVCYSETLSLFLLLLSIHFFVGNTNKKTNLFWCAFFIALGALVRPQIAIAFPAFGFILLIKKVPLKLKIQELLIYGITVVLVFGTWPARNYINFHKFVLMQDLRGVPNWHGETLAFTSFIYSAQADWEPQFTQILKNKPVDFPNHFVGSKQDSLKLMHTFEMCRNNGVSFSYWVGHWRKKFMTDTSKTDSIVKAFNDLRLSQIQKNPFVFYCVLPFENFKKAVFKSSLYDTKSTARKIASLLFYYRTLLIILGLIGCILMMRKKHLFEFALFSLMYWGLLYIALCAGTGPMFRNIEIRYFMHPDVVLLVPAAFALFHFYQKIFAKNLANTSL